MTQQLVSIYHPDNYYPSVKSEATSRAIDPLSWVRIFPGGFSPARSARLHWAQPAEVAEARLSKPAIGERLELAFVATLALAVIASMILFFAAAGGTV